MSLRDQRIQIAIPAGIATWSAPGAGPALPYVMQSETNWCWAACGEMLFHLPGQQHRSQCQVASSRFGSCCPSPTTPAACDRGEWPDVAYPPLGLPTYQVGRSLSVMEIRAQLLAGKPVQVCYNWTNSNATHVALIVDEHPNGDFEVYDPGAIFGPGPRSYGQIMSGYGGGAWILSFTF